MNRKEFYYIDDKEVTREEWLKKYNSDYNFSTLTIKYKDCSTESLLKEIKELKEKISKLEQQSYINVYPNENPWSIRPLTTEITYETNH